jgi:hypothetical protein
MFGGCVFVGILLYRAGLFDSAPELPSFARPVDAKQLSNEQVQCYNNDDFGPYLRSMVFGTDLDFQQAVLALRTEFEQRGWTVEHFENDYLYVSSPNDELRISYSQHEATSPFVDDEVQDDAAQFRSVISVSVEDECPV